MPQKPAILNRTDMSPNNCYSKNLHLTRAGHKSIRARGIDIERNLLSEVRLLHQVEGQVAPGDQGHDPELEHLLLAAAGLPLVGGGEELLHRLGLGTSRSGPGPGPGVLCFRLGRVAGLLGSGTLKQNRKP